MGLLGIKPLMFFLSIVVGLSVDCPDIINLALGFNMHLVKPLVMSALYTDCCNYASTFVNCVNNRVDYIYWVQWNLNGTINMTAIPDKLTNFIVSHGKIKGNITKIPSHILAFDMVSHQLTGTLPEIHPLLQSYRMSANLIKGGVLSLTNSLKTYEVEGMSLGGSIPPIPSSMVSLLIQGNLLTGSFPNISTHTQLNYLSIGSNLLNGTVSMLPSSLQILYIYSNSFSGCFPLIPANIRTFYIGYNNFEGALSLSSPTDISITQNKFSAIEIKDKSLLSTYCDISYNSLLGKVSNYTRCSRSGQIAGIPSNCPILLPATNLSSSQKLQSSSKPDYTSIYTINDVSYVTTSAVYLDTSTTSLVDLNQETNTLAEESTHVLESRLLSTTVVAKRSNIYFTTAGFSTFISTSKVTKSTFQKSLLSSNATLIKKIASTVNLNNETFTFNAIDSFNVIDYVVIDYKSITKVIIDFLVLFGICWLLRLTITNRSRKRHPEFSFNDYSFDTSRVTSK